MNRLSTGKIKVSRKIMANKASFCSLLYAIREGEKKNIKEKIYVGISAG
jgi:hypothetical protein